MMDSWLISVGARVGLVVILATVVLVGCDRSRPMVGHGALGGSVVGGGEAQYSVQWHALDEQRHHVLDEIFMELSAQPEAEEQSERVLLLLAELAPGSPITLSRLALMRLRFRASAARFREVFEITKRLSVEAPEHPDRLFLEGYVRWFALRGGIGANSMDLAKQSKKGLLATWGKLLESHPDFRGPMGFHAQRIRSELALLTEPSPTPQ